MKDIKTRDHVRGIRTIDKAAVANEHMKNVAIRAKENSFDRTQDDGESASDYSAQQIQNYAADAAHDVKDTALVAQHRARQKKKNTATPSHSERGRQKAKRTIQKKNQPSSQNGGISSSKRIKTRNGAKTVKQKGYTRPSAKKGGIGNAAAQKQASASTRQAAAKAQYMKKVVAKQTSVGIKVCRHDNCKGKVSHSCIGSRRLYCWLCYSDHLHGWADSCLFFRHPFLW